MALIAAGGVVIGAVGKGALDWLLAIGKVKADREARAEARQEKRAERRDDLQRQTLLDLQSATMELVTLTAERSPGSHVGLGLGGAHRAAQATVRMLRSRVRDDALRQMTEELQVETTRVILTADATEAREGEDAIAAVFPNIQDRAGELLRHIDDLPARLSV